MTNLTLTSWGGGGAQPFRLSVLPFTPLLLTSDRLCVTTKWFYQLRFLLFQWSKANNFVLHIPKHILYVAIKTEVPVSNRKYQVVSKEGQFFCG